MKKRILYVKFGFENSTIQNDLINKKLYKFDLCFSYDEFMSIFQEKTYDFVLIEIEDEDETKFIVHYLLQQQNKQAILLIREIDSNCIFEQECKFCQENFNHKSINCVTTVDKVMKFIDQPNTTKCDFEAIRNK